MKDVTNHSRSRIEPLLRQALIGSSLQRVTYAIAYWELLFSADEDAKLVASEIVVANEALDDEESKRAILVGSQLLALTNTSRVASISLHTSGDFEISFTCGKSIRVLGEVPQVDWTWTLETAKFRFTCDGPLKD